MDKFTPSFSCGVDSDGTKGGLALFSWYLGNVFCIASSSNFIFCNVVDINGSSRHLLFLYGASKVEDRPKVWEEISILISSTPNVLIMGDINQLEYYSNKLGGSSLIKGLDVFLDWRFQTNLLEVPFTGPRYTWSNKRLGTELIMEQLDRAYSSSQWFNNFPDGRVTHEPITVSDHATIIYDLDTRLSKSNRPYQIETWCLVFPEIKTIIGEAWGVQCSGSVMYKFQLRSKWLRDKMKRWCLDNKKVWGINWRKYSTELHDQGGGITTLEQGNSYVSAINETITQSGLEFKYWQQRIKDWWIKEGYMSSKMMYGRVKQRKQRREIVNLRKDDEIWVQGQENLQQLIRDTLREVYNPPMDSVDIMNEKVDLVLRDLDLPSIAPEDASFLIRPFSHQEIRKTMFYIHNLKAPGQDGYIAEIFHQHWEEVGSSVVESVQSFFSTGHLLKEFNASLLVMILKVDCLELPTQFRPISLCNTIYKCIAKCMVNRIKTLLPGLISKYQHAFVPDRYIEDNVMLSHELLHLVYTSNGESTKAVIKLDMSKAYDSVNWTFLLRVLTTYDFREFGYNGSQNVSEMFKSECGLRKGDPLSPYLFLFCMDILSRMFSMAEDINLIKGLWVTRMYCNPQLLVARSLDPIHECPLCVGGARSCLRGNASWGRQGLFNVANKRVKGYHWKIGNGERVKVANMRWVQGLTHVFKSSHLLRGVGSGRVKYLISPEIRSWNVAIIRERFEWSTAQEILEMELPLNEEKDANMEAQYSTKVELVSLEASHEWRKTNNIFLGCVLLRGMLGRTVP
ncbi:uncharacterized protein LOC110725987 [Chenopodium quinoa]|uniref:uncharacterized protein LOC110725987 n=1 Tax=Chenopodium quinoa TaxID=63459 RepID=UPI000B77FE8D|nr:uncharacterized protein LOC110725987 [Chenopodium quinoa]